MSKETTSIKAKKPDDGGLVRVKKWTEVASDDEDEKTKEINKVTFVDIINKTIQKLKESKDNMSIPEIKFKNTTNPQEKEKVTNLKNFLEELKNPPKD